MATIEDFKRQWRDGIDFIEAHTSGSTGTPKPIRLLKSDMRASARATNTFFSIGADSSIAAALSVDYIAGKMMVVRALEAGCKLVELPVSRTVEIPDGIILDLLAVVPAQLQSLLERPELSARIRNLLIGGAAPSALQSDELRKAGYKAFISYGMTETCSHVALAEASDPQRVYHAMPGISFEVDENNCLTVNAPHFSFGKLATRDVVDLLDEKSFMWRGRADGVINSGGLKFYPEELEALYARALQGFDYYVVGRPDEVWGHAVQLVIEAEEIDCEDIRRRLAAVVSEHRKLPKDIVAVAELDRTTSGKIKRIPR